MTPGEFYLDPNSGGMVVYTVKPPEGSGFDTFNRDWKDTDEQVVRPSGYDNVTMPYKQIRAVIFSLYMFHTRLITQLQTGV